MKICGIILIVLYSGLMIFAVCKDKTKRHSFLDVLPSLCIVLGSVLNVGYAIWNMVWSRSVIILLIFGMLCISAGTLLNGFKQKKVHIPHHIVRLIVEAGIVAICWLSVNGMKIF